MEKPDKNGAYLACFRHNNEDIIEKATFNKGQFYSILFGEDSGYEDDCLYAEEIISWMSLPKLPEFYD